MRAYPRGETKTGKKHTPIRSRRGQFRTYTTEAPLFGKWTGTWWWRPVWDATAAERYLYKIDRPSIKPEW